MLTPAGSRYLLKDRDKSSRIAIMEGYKERFARTLAETGALFFDKGLILKDRRPTPYFVNMGMFRTGRSSKELGSYFADMIVGLGFVNNGDIILGPSYKGSALALATAIALYTEHGLDVLFDYDRKEAKDHGEGSQSKSLFVNRTFFEGCGVFVVDDVATSMGTKYELVDKIQSEAEAKKITLKVQGIGIGIDREQTTAVYDDGGEVCLGQKGENAIRSFVEKTGIPVYSLAGVREVVEFLCRESIPVMINGSRRPIDDETKSRFDMYLKTYGTD